MARSVLCNNDTPSKMSVQNLYNEIKKQTKFEVKKLPQ
jgi:hypothetical protein